MNDIIFRPVQSSKGSVQFDLVTEDWTEETDKVQLNRKVCTNSNNALNNQLLLSLYISSCPGAPVAPVAPRHAASCHADQN